MYLSRTVECESVDILSVNLRYENVNAREESGDCGITPRNRVSKEGILPQSSKVDWVASHRMTSKPYVERAKGLY